MLQRAPGTGLRVIGMRGVTVKIAEVSKKYGLSADTLRYYERAGLLGQVTRTKSGIRNYSDEDCERIEFVMTMRNAGIPVEMLAEYVSLFERGEEGAILRKAVLQQQREIVSKRITELNETLKWIDDEIESCA
ncbi:MerR family transcriptional regulator [Slackia heliotrinireducens]|nr:MerR family transcriptional regulator [Slackia heliotrinireducens]